MKKILLLLFPVFMLISCNKDTDKASEISGGYNFSRVSNCIVTVEGQTATIPLNTTGNAIISRISNNRISLDMGAVFTGNITDDHISFDSYTETSSANGMTLALTISSVGDIAGTTINITETYSGTCYFQGLSYPISGKGSVVLRKK